MKSRFDALQSAAGRSFDLCVIGGGATGAGCALDAQLRGLRTVLIEGADFASGASSASTKMVHGGVRYLEQAVRRLDFGEYKVVKCALRERVRMLRNAPFLTRTRQFVTPCYRWREAAYYETGLKLYDWIAGKAGLAPSRFLSREEALRRIPALRATGLVGAVAYTDGQFDDARYNIALVETFAAAGGEALNYARVAAFEKDAAGAIAAADVEDQIGGKSFAVRARVFVNATGAHSDTLRSIANPAAPPRMRPSRGVHIVLPLAVLGHAPGASEDGDALLIPKTEDGRVLFAIPWMGRLLVGTTDEPIDQPESSTVTRAEIEYLLRHLNRYLANPVALGQVMSAFAGVRPLVASSEARPRATKELARDHVVEVDAASGLVSVMGGKWTTYRAMAEDTIDAVERRLDRPHASCRTESYALAGAEGFAPELWRTLVAEFEVSQSSAQHLSGKFGSRAAQVLALAREDAALGAPLADGLAPIKAEVLFCARHEMAVSMEDILARRVGLESHGWQEARAAAPAVAELLAAELHWPAESKQRALEQYLARIDRQAHEAGLGE